MSVNKLPVLTGANSIQDLDQDLISPSTVVMVAPLDGEIIPLAEFPDQVFASGMLGIGVGFMPQGTELVAPAAGQVVSIFPGGHALLIQTPEGLELLLHIGLDTVDLNGKGFETLCQEGDSVKPGQPLIKFDSQVITHAGKQLHTALIVTNKEVIGEYGLAEAGKVVAGQTPVFALRPGR